MDAQHSLGRVGFCFLAFLEDDAEDNTDGGAGGNISGGSSADGPSSAAASNTGRALDPEEVNEDPFQDEGSASPEKAKSGAAAAAAGSRFRRRPPRPWPLRHRRWGEGRSHRDGEVGGVGDRGVGPDGGLGVDGGVGSGSCLMPQEAQQGKKGDRTGRAAESSTVAVAAALTVRGREGGAPWKSKGCTHMAMTLSLCGSWTAGAGSVALRALWGGGGARTPAPPPSWQPLLPPREKRKEGAAQIPSTELPARGRGTRRCTPLG